MDEEMLNYEEPEEFDDEEFENDIYRGTIRGFQGSYMSGIATLVIEDNEGMVQYLNCDNGQTVRSLENAFGNVIGDAHDVKPEGGHLGEEIFYHIDMFGLLEWFIPVKKAPKEFIQEYNRKYDDSGLPDFAM